MDKAELYNRMDQLGPEAALKHSDGSLKEALWQAVEACWNSIDDVEERGGIIIRDPKTDTYRFIPIHNSNHGQPNAPYLYTADRDMYAKEIIPLMRSGWRHYASFHTHPQFEAYPSFIDMTELFPGFPINYIYSGLKNKLIKYTWIEPHNTNVGLIPEEVEI